MPSSGRVSGTDRVCSTSATSRSTSCSDLLGGQVGGADLALRLGADMPASARSSGAPPPPPAPVRRSSATHSASSAALAVVVGARARRDHGSDRVGAAEDLGGFGVPGGALLGQGCGVRAWRPGSPRWPAAPAAAPPPASVAGRGRAGTRRRARRAGPRCCARRVDQRWFSAGSTPTISRTGRFRGSRVGAFGEPDAQAGRGGGAPGRCCRSPTRPRWP